MVRVISQQNKQRVQQRIQQIQQSQQQLRSQIQRTQNQRVTNQEALRQKQRITQQLRNTSNDLTQQTRSLQPFTRLPTPSEAIAQQQGQLKGQIQQARKILGLVNQGKLSTSQVPKNIRELAVQIAEGRNERELLNLQQAQLEEISPDFQGPVRPATEETFFRRTGISLQNPLPGFEDKINDFSQPTVLERRAVAERERLLRIGGALSTPLNLSDFRDDRRANVGVLSVLQQLGQRGGEILSASQISGPAGPVETRVLQTAGSILAPTLFFNPAFSSGVASQQTAEAELVFDDVAQELITRKELARRTLQRLLRSGANEVTINQGSINQRTVNIREFVRQAIQRNANNPKQLAKLRQQLINQGRGGLFNDLISQEGITLTSSLPSAVRDVPRTLDLGSTILAGSTTQRPVLTGSGAETQFRDSEFAGTGQFERTDLQQSNVFGLFSQQQPQQLQNQVPVLATSNALGLRTPQAQRQLENQQQQERARQRQPQPQLTPTASILGTPQQLQQPQQTGQGQPQGSIEEVIPQFQTPVRPIPRLPLSPNVQAVISRMKKTKLKDAFDVFVRKKGKNVKIADNLPRNLGMKKLKNFLSGDIARSGFLKLDGKTKKKDIRPVSLGNMFRRPKGKSKLNPFSIVEKSKFALDSPTEKRQIKKANRKKKR